MEATQCLISDEGIKKLRYIYTMAYHAAVRKEGIMKFVDGIGRCPAT